VKTNVFFDYFLYYFLSILMIALVLIIFISVILRWFGLNIFWAEEVLKLLFVWIVYIGTIAVYKKNRLIAVEVIFNLLSVKAKRIVEMMDICLTTILLALLIIASAKLVILQLKTITTALMISYSVFTISALISFSVIFVLKVKHFFSHFIQKNNQKFRRQYHI